MRQTLDTPGEGRVLVIDGGGSLRRALLGDQLAALGRKERLGRHRRLGLHPRFARHRRNGYRRARPRLPTRKKTVKKNLGDAEIPVSFAGIDFHPGAWLYADEDGLIVSAEPLHA